MYKYSINKCLHKVSPMASPQNYLFRESSDKQQKQVVTCMFVQIEHLLHIMQPS